MSSNNFIKQNFVLLVGLTMPVLLVVAFFLSTVLPQRNAVPPQYAMLFTTTTTQNNVPFGVSFFVKDGKLMTRFTKTLPPYNNYYGVQKLMVYDGKTQSSHELPFDTSRIGEIKDQMEVSLPEFASLKVSGETKAPDGYSFENGGYSGYGIVPELFGSGYRSYTPRVTKDGAVFKIPDVNRNYYDYSSIQFIGWIVK